MLIRISILFILICIIQNNINGINSAQIKKKKSINESYPDDESTTVALKDTSPSSQSARKARYVALLRGSSWLEALGEGNPCLISTGQIGACTSFHRCYPNIRFSTNNYVFNSWFLGNYDTCSYFSSNGQQAFGICCTNVQGAPDYTDGSNQIDNDEHKRVDSSISQWPPPVPTHPTRATNRPSIMQWPPPIPTHPPDHTAPTHPTKPSSPADYPFDSSTTRRPTTTTRRTTTSPWWTSTTTTQHPWWTSTTTTQQPWWTSTTTKQPWWTTTKSTTRWTTTTRKPTSQWPPTHPPLPTHPPFPTHPPSPTQSPVPIESDYEEINQASCGAKNGALDQERIVGGHTASPNEYPWIVVLFNGGRQFCGGSLIDSIHIVTAAHCVAQMTSWDVARVTAHLGDHDIRNQNEVQHITRKIKRVVRHKGFDFSHLHNDVAVITMDQPVTFTKSVSPICMPSGSSSKSYYGQVATVAGWGSLRENGPQPSVLQKVSIPIWSNTECARKYGTAAPAGIVSSMLCAGQSTKDSCSGDSGGPLMVNEGGRYVLAGIVSWGIGCGKGQYPGVYTRVSSFMPWITKNLKP